MYRRQQINLYDLYFGLFLLQRGFRSEPVEDLENYYDMSGEKLMVIFNHFEYQSTAFFGNKKPKTRKGTAADVKRLTTVFEGLGFDVTPHQDPGYDEIIDVVTEVTKRDHSKTSCVAVVILTHGCAGGELYAADRPYSFNDVLVPFQNGHPSLLDKPKLFILQACRGSNVDSGRVMYDGHSNNASLMPTHANFLILYSTVEDYAAWRDANGSWLIQELCSTLERHSQDLDLLGIITQVNRRVAIQRISYNTDPELHNKKQVPETKYTLTKILKF